MENVRGEMRLERQWERFSGGPARTQVNTFRVTINQKGSIYMNRAAHRLIGSPRAVTVYFNRSLDSIALEPAEAENEQSFPVSRKQNGWVIHAASFCRHYNIRVPNTEKFVFPKRDEAGRLILNLRETVIVGGIQRKRNRSKF